MNEANNNNEEPDSIQTPRYLGFRIRVLRNW